MLCGITQIEEKPILGIFFNFFILYPVNVDEMASLDILLVQYY